MKKYFLLTAIFALLNGMAMYAAGNTVYLDGENGSDSGDGSADKPVLTFAKAKGLLATDGTIYIVGTVTVSGTEGWSLETATYGNAIVKRGASFNKEMVIIADNGSLTLSNITLDGGSRSVSNGSTASIIKMTQAALTLGDGAVLQNNYNTRSGGGVHASDGSTVTMQTGAKIENCGTWTNLFAGGGVALYNSTMNMTGGTITNCRANKGGGVAVIASTFNMSGGEISECTLYDYGYKDTSGLPKPVYSTSTNAFGCGVLVSNGLTGGTATTSPAKNYNGTFAYYTGVQNFTVGTSTFNMSGGTLKDNGVLDFTTFTASQQPLGGGVCAIPHNMSNYLESNKDSDASASLLVNISGTATITGNGAAWGGGVACFFTASCLTMTGGTIDGNQAYNDGGGIFLATRNTNTRSSKSGSLNPRPSNSISKGTVKNNIAYSHGKAGGGGIALRGWTNSWGFSGGATLRIRGDETYITGNQAYGIGGGGIYAGGSPLLVLYSGNITNNKTLGYSADFPEQQGWGAGIYSSNTMYLYGGTISGNVANAKLRGIGADGTKSYSNGVYCESHLVIQDATSGTFTTFGENDDICSSQSTASNSRSYYYVLVRTYNKDNLKNLGKIPVSSVKARDIFDSLNNAYRWPFYTIEDTETNTAGIRLIQCAVYDSNNAFDGAASEEATAKLAEDGTFVPSAAMLEANPTLEVIHSQLNTYSSKKIFLTYAGSEYKIYYNSVAPVKTGATSSTVVQKTEKEATIWQNPFTEDAGYDLIGGRNLVEWNTASDGSGTSYMPGEKIELTGDLMLYAIWDTYTVTYWSTKEENTAQKVTYTYRYDDAVVLKEYEAVGFDENATGYEPDGFQSWSSNTKIATNRTGGSPGYSFKIPTNVVFKPSYYNSTSKLTYKPGDGTGTDVEKNVGRGSTVTLADPDDLGFTAPDGKYFAGWAYDNEPRTEAPTTVSSPYPVGTAYKMTYNFSSGGVYTYTDHVLTATWSDDPPTKYTLTYDANGGSGTAPDAESYYAGEKARAVEVADGKGGYILTKDGYYLSGWNTSKDGGDATHVEPGTSITMDSDKTLYAEWTLVYKVEYDANGGSLIAGKENLTDNNRYKPGKKAIVLDGTNVYENKYEDGGKTRYHTLTGWNTKADGTGTPYKPGDIIYITGNVKLYAQWEDRNEKFTLTYDTNGGTALNNTDTKNPSVITKKNGTDDEFQEVFYKNDIVELKYRVPTKDGSVFAGWYFDQALTNRIPQHPNQELEIEKDTTIYADWGYYVTFDPNGGEMSMPDDVTAVDNGDGTYSVLVKDGGLVKEPDAPTRGTGCAFDGWYTEKTDGEKWDFAADTVTKPVTLYAHWKITVTFDPNGGEMERPDGNNVTDNGDGTYSVIVAEGELLTEPDEPTRYGYFFDGWFTEKDGGVKWIFSSNIVTEPMTLYAQWVRDYLVDIDRYVHISEAPGVVTDPAAGYHYVSGHDNFTFTATFANGEPQKVFATGYYSKKTLELEPEDMGEGVYKYTLRQVTEPWEISFGSVPGASDVGDESITDATRIWSNGSTLYISAPAETQADIYAITGALVKTLRLPAGETRETLERGIYIVKTGSKTAKIVIR